MPATERDISRLLASYQAPGLPTGVVTRIEQALAAEAAGRCAAAGRG